MLLKGEQKRYRPQSFAVKGVLGKQDSKNNRTKHVALQ